MLVIRLTHVSHTRHLSSDNSGQPVALTTLVTSFCRSLNNFVPGRRLFQTHAMAENKAGIEFVFVRRLFPI
jgi:hypothetical protein